MLWRAHERRGETDDALRVLLRIARVPAGPAGDARIATRPREALLHSARVLLRRGAISLIFNQSDAWLFLAAAAAQLLTFGASGVPTQLRVSPAFLINEWAPRVRSLGGPQIPGWFMPFVRRAGEIPARRPEQPEANELPRSQGSLSRDITLAAIEAKGADTERRRPLARFGVWLELPQ